MFYTILPKPYHLAAEQFLQRLPLLAANTPTCSRLKPLSLLVEVARLTLAAVPHSIMAETLTITTPAAKRRDKAIRQLLRQHEPDVYQAVLALELATPVAILAQMDDFKHWLHQLLNTRTMTCVYCASLRTLHIGQRLNFRCRDCRRTFNPLKPYMLHRLSHCELWLAFIDHLLLGATCQEINRALGINVSTAAKWQRYFLWLMRQQGFSLLADYCVNQRRRRYRQTWLDVQSGATFLTRGGSRFKPKWH